MLHVWNVAVDTDFLDLYTNIVYPNRRLFISDTSPTIVANPLIHNTRKRWYVNVFKKIIQCSYTCMALFHQKYHYDNKHTSTPCSCNCVVFSSTALMFEFLLVCEYLIRLIKMLRQHNAIANHIDMFNKILRRCIRSLNWIPWWNFSKELSLRNNLCVVIEGPFQLGTYYVASGSSDLRWK